VDNVKVKGAQPARQTGVGRREILKGAAVAAAASGLGPFFPGRVLGANDRVALAVIGVRNQGRAHIQTFAGLKNVQIKFLCDIDENVLGERLASFEKTYGYKPSGAFDMRKVFDDKDVDAVTFATPNHWHALGTIWACQAKKHVYVEKPACHNVWEGRQMIGAARKHGVLVQVGFQSRSRPAVLAAMKFLHEGKLGKVYMARGLCFKPRENIGLFLDGPMAEGAKLPPMSRQKMPYTASYLEKVHYDEWMGPAPKRPFNPNRFHYNWHWQWAYGGGDTANQGPHQFDVARWGLQKDDYPVRVRSDGGLFLHNKSQQETPNMQTSIFEYADGTVLEFATRGLPTNAEGELQIGVVFYGSEGRLEIDAEGQWKTFLGPKGEPGPNSQSIQQEASDARNTVGTGMEHHCSNFIQAVQSGKASDLACAIEVGHRSTVLPLVANISYRLKRELRMDTKGEQFVNDKEASGLLKRVFRPPYVVPSLVA
jgi:predicted dehydrogenase